MNNVTGGLIKNGNKVKVISVNTFKHPLNVAALPEDYISKTQIETVFVDTRLRYSAAFLNLFSGQSYHVSRFYSKVFENKISEVLNQEEFDIVLLESLFVTPYIGTIKKNSRAKIVYRAHNIEYEIWKKIALGEKNFFKKFYLGLLSEKLKKYEFLIFNKVDGICSISTEDLKKMLEAGCVVPVETVNFGIDFSDYAFSHSGPVKLNLFFIASFDWLPNLQGLNWFLNSVWEIAIKKNPDVKLVIAGKSMSGEFSSRCIKNTLIIGEVENAVKFMSENGIMIVPLLSGSGIRVKIIEAMAIGKVIIATSVAVKGIHCRNMENILIADTPEEFANHIHLAITDSELRKKISANARKFAVENFDNQILIKKLVAFFKRIQ